MTTRTRSAFAAVALVLLAPSSKVLAATLHDGVAQYQAKNYQAAADALLPLAADGDAEAQRRVGEMYYYGQGVTKDLGVAIKWLRAAANTGDRIAQYDLGYFYEHGDGVPADRDTAIQWYLKSSAQNYAEAEYRLGLLYESTDKAMAATFYEKAYNQGHPAAGARYHAITNAIAQAQVSQGETAEEHQWRSRGHAEEEHLQEVQRDSQRFEEEREREAQSRAEMAAMLVNGFSQLAATAAQGQARIEAAKHGVILPPARTAYGAPQSSAAIAGTGRVYNPAPRPVQPSPQDSSPASTDVPGGRFDACFHKVPTPAAGSTTDFVNEGTISLRNDCGQTVSVAVLVNGAFPINYWGTAVQAGGYFQVYDKRGKTIQEIPVQQIQLETCPEDYTSVWLLNGQEVSPHQSSGYVCRKQ
jgi:TPR repeat protein